MNYRQQIMAGMSFLSLVGGAATLWKGGIYYGKSNLDWSISNGLFDDVLF